MCATTGCTRCRLSQSTSPHRRDGAASPLPRGRSVRHPQVKRPCSPWHGGNGAHRRATADRKALIVRAMADAFRQSLHTPNTVRPCSAGIGKPCPADLRGPPAQEGRDRRGPGIGVGHHRWRTPGTPVGRWPCRLDRCAEYGDDGPAAPACTKRLAAQHSTTPARSKMDVDQLEDGRRPAARPTWRFGETSRRRLSTGTSAPTASPPAQAHSLLDEHTIAVLLHRAGHPLCVTAQSVRYDRGMCCCAPMTTTAA